MSQTEFFYKTAKEFCNYLQENEITKESIDYLLSTLMKLYVYALELPHAEPETTDRTETAKRPRQSIKFHKDFPTYYRMFFNPIDDKEPVCGDLFDDLSDIVKDFQDGIDEYEAGKIGNAIFEWSFGLKNHWGCHVINAINAFHTIRNS